MNNKIQALETMIDMVIDSAADIEDLTEIIEILYKKASILDEKIIKTEEESL